MKLWCLQWMTSCLLMVSLLSKGRQVRSQSAGLCIEPLFDENGDIVIVFDCVCDPSCEICGYYGDTFSGPQDCFTCPDGFVHTEIFDDGSGTCTESDDDSLGTTDPPPETLSPTEAPTDPVSDTSPPPSDTDTPDDSSSTFGGICMVVYQMADTDLESFLREDLSEITMSLTTQNLSTTTWIYFDGLDSGDANYTGGPLADIYEPDGSVSTESTSASRYLNWDHDLGKMVVNTTFSSELNSDSPVVLEAFLKYALTDCVDQGKTEYFLVFSSHGAGFDGFGGDNDTEERRRRRKLLQSTSDMVSAIQGALSSVPGAPSLLDVLGFDACLMQSMDVIDDFASITRYFLASEAIEPGHGWAYNELSVTDSAVDLAVDVVATFVSSLQNNSRHLAPKTLSVVDTAAFPAFRDAWDALCSEMADILGSGNDADFHVSLLRARGQTLGFIGVLDLPSFPIYSAMDIGDFLVQFFQLCDPDESSQLYTLMNSAYDAYNAMFVVNGLGPGTPSATGMYITWVSKQVYVPYEEFYKDIIFPSTGSLPLKGVPNYGRFLELYYNTSTPLDNVGTSVCATSTGASAESPSDLIIDPVLLALDASTKQVRYEITRNVDYVRVEYGIDVTHFLQDQGFRRRLDESARRQQARRREADKGEGTRLSSFPRHHDDMKWRYQNNGDTPRKLQQGGDIFLIYGGSLAVEYDGPTVVASWDSNFYWIQSGDDLEPVYANEYGGGLKSIPVCYFDESHPVSRDQIEAGITVEDAMEVLGCEQGFLSFSSAENSDGEINLYVNRGSTFSEVPRADGRTIVPISSILFSVDGVLLTELLGGFTSVIIPWTPESAVSILTFSDSLFLEVLQSDTAFLQILAYDEDLEVSDLALLSYTIEQQSSETENPTSDVFDSLRTSTLDTNENAASDPPADTDANALAEPSSNGTRISPLQVGITTTLILLSLTIMTLVCNDL